MTYEIFVNVIGSIVFLLLLWIGKKLIFVWKHFADVNHVREKWKTLSTPRSKYYYLQFLKFRISSLQHGQTFLAIMGVALLVLYISFRADPRQNLFQSILSLLLITEAFLMIPVFVLIGRRITTFEDVVEEFYKEVIDAPMEAK